MLSEAKHPVPGLRNEIPFDCAQGRLRSPRSLRMICLTCRFEAELRWVVTSLLRICRV